MKPEIFQTQLLTFLNDHLYVLQNAHREWVIKGFIDIYKNIYPVSIDTKVVSKIIELLLFPTLTEFARTHHLKMVLAKEQNYYPDISLIDESDNTLFALDLKSTYRKIETQVNGFTLGAFTGYFRNRNSTKNIMYRYDEYNAHFILGVIYSKSETDALAESQIFHIDELEEICSHISDFTFLVQEKYRIASTRPGSGNTKTLVPLLTLSC